MKLHPTILVLACLLAPGLASGPALAQFRQISGNHSVLDAGHGERHSPHYYTVRNILRNHRSMKSASTPGAMGILPAASLSTSEVDLESDVVFEGGGYHFHMRLQDSIFKARLRKAEGRWVLEIRDEIDDSVLGAYVLER